MSPARGKKPTGKERKKKTIERSEEEELEEGKSTKDNNQTQAMAITTIHVELLM